MKPRTSDRLTDRTTPAAPDERNALRLHAAVKDGKTGARDEIASWALPRVTEILQPEFRHIDSAAVEQAAEEAILRYLVRPAIWQPSKAGLLTFVVQIARNRLLTRLRSMSRYDRAERAFAAAQPASTSPVSDWDRQLLLASVRKELAGTRAEQRFLDLLVVGERRAAVYAEALGIADRPITEQRQAVKRVRDRLMWRARKKLNETGG